MDPATPVIKSINRLLQLEIQKINEDFNLELLPLVRQSQDLAYAKFRNCLMKNPNIHSLPECYERFQKYSLAVDFDAHSKKLMNCVERTLQSAQSVASDIEKCGKGYAGGLQEDIRKELKRVRDL